MIYLFTHNDFEHIFYNKDDKEFYSVVEVSSDIVLYLKICESDNTEMHKGFEYELPEELNVMYIDYDKRLFHSINILEKLIFNKL